jgi:hypothetical protein
MNDDLAALKAEVTRLEKLVYVPGVWKCAKCGYGLVSTNLHPDSGRFSANNSPQQCPNGCGPMWRKTERDAGNELIARMDTTRDDALEQAARLCDDYARDGRLERKYACEVADEIAARIRNLKIGAS